MIAHTTNLNRSSFKVQKSLLIGLALLLGACTDKTTPDVKTKTPAVSGENPQSLSEWGVLEVENGILKLGAGSTQYELRSALFSDYAHKLRTVSIPDGQTATIGQDGDVVEFPVGTVISKTFYYPRGTSAGDVLKAYPANPAKGSLDISKNLLIETRLLIHKSDGWTALPYVWNEDQSDALLQRTGAIKRFTLVDGQKRNEFAYLVPDANQCAGCHATNNTTREIVPIGPKLRHLKSADGWLNQTDIPDGFAVNVNYNDSAAPIAKRARAYLDINCSHCHNEVGPADTSGLHLELKSVMGPNFGRCKMPIAAGTGTGNRKYGIVPGKPGESIFIFRMASTNPAVMMPELGRSLPHTEGVTLIESWIETLEGNCEAG